MTAMHQHTLCLVAAYDFSDGGDLVIDRSLQMAARYPSSSIHIVTAIPEGLARLSNDLPSTDSRETAADEMREKLVVAVAHRVARLRDAVDRPQAHNVNVHTRIGEPADVIAAVANEVCADLVVVGTHEKSGVSRLVPGSVSEHVVRGAPCPVLVVRDTHYAQDLRGLPEPPCPRCVATRHLGDAWWCDVHARLEDREPPYESPLKLTFERDIERLRRKSWVVN